MMVAIGASTAMGRTICRETGSCASAPVAVAAGAGVGLTVMLLANLPDRRFPVSKRLTNLSESNLPSERKVVSKTIRQQHPPL